jgi:putative CocE/NonD family hydrolase
MSEHRDPNLPHDVDERSPFWIPMPDGTRLAGRAWLPSWASPERPVPALLELIPYRTRDLTAPRDEALHGTFAANGYASVRVDIRGSGDSEGLIPGEYLAQELQDGADIIAWLAVQPWCTGAVGMFGNSWGGFNALQVAALRPPALRAIITSCSTDDRFTDDMHWMGGALLTDMLDWGCTFLTWMALPPDPAVTGPSWRERWLERIALAVDAPAVVDWIAHQERDAFWRHGSLNEAYGDITVPVLAVGGWQDGYSNAIPRLLAGLSGPRMGVVGAWAHGYPHAAPPGPNIDFFALAVRWWDRWLRDDPAALDGLPAYQAFVAEGLPPEPFYAEAPGRWVAEDAWPSPRVRPARWALDEGGVLAPVGGPGSSGPEAIVEVRTDQTVGVAAGEWCPFGTGGRGPELPGDQAPDDARSVCFDSDALRERVEILGAPIVRLSIPADAWPGLVVVRLCDVWPDGRSTRVTYAVRHVGAPGDPGPADGVLEVRLNDAGHAFLPGHRIRIALSTTSWPMVWPEAVPSTLAFLTGASELELPIRPVDAAPEAADLGAAWRPAPRVDVLAAGRHERVVEADGDRQIVRNTIDGGRSRVLATGVTCGTRAEDIASMAEGDPLSARMTSERRVTLEHPDGTTVAVTGWLELTATAVTWELRGRLRAEERDAFVADRTFERSIPRRVP